MVEPRLEQAAEVVERRLEQAAEEGDHGVPQEALLKSEFPQSTIIVVGGGLAPVADHLTYWLIPRFCGALQLPKSDSEYDFEDHG